MKISVITPTYNAEKTLERTIASVLGQGYPDLEYIVVDGLSNDGTLAIVEKHKGRISRWVSERDKGIYDAMNKGVKMAQGEWIGILNGDDVYTDGVLHAVAELARKHPDAEVLYGDIRMVFADRPAYFFKSKNPLRQSHFWKMPIWHPTMFVRKDVYERLGGFLDTYRIASDYELVLRLFRAKARFQYSGSQWVEMAGGGASDVSWLKGKHELRAIAESHGVFTGRLKLLFFLDLYRVRLSGFMQSVPLLKTLQLGYRKAKSKLEPGF